MQARPYRRRLLAAARTGPSAPGRAPRTAGITGSRCRKPALDLIELHLADRSSAQMSSRRLKQLVAEFGLERVTPHDLRRTCLTTITRLRFGRDAMDRIANHRKGGVTDVYDRHGYEDGGPADHGRGGTPHPGPGRRNGKTNVVALR